MHLTFAQLRALVETDEQHEHLDSCQICQLTYRKLGGEGVQLTAELEQTNRLSTDRRDPARNQLWSLTADSVKVFILIRSVGTWTIEATPITESPQLVANALCEWWTDDSPLGFSAAAWTHPTRTLPIAALDECYGLAEHSDTDAGETVPLGPAGEALLSDWEEHADEITETTGPAFVGSEIVNAADDWESILHGLGAKPTDIAHALGWYPGQVVDLIRGSRFLEPDERASLAQALGVDESDLPAASYPQPLMLELVRPRRRPLVRTTATTRQIGESEARAQLASKVLAVAARSDADPLTRWQQILDDIEDDL